MCWRPMDYPHGRLRCNFKGALIDLGKNEAMSSYYVGGNNFRLLSLKHLAIAMVRNVLEGILADNKALKFLQMGDQQHNRISIMNFGKQLLGQDEKQFEMNNTWVPITPEKLVLLRSNTTSDWPVNQLRRANYQEIPVPRSDYMKEKLLHHQGPNQNLHLMGQTGRTGENKTFDDNLADRNSVLDHIPGSYTQPWHYESNGSNSNTLELLLQKNTTNIASADRNLDASINMAARNPPLPKFYPQASNDVRDPYAGVQRCNIHSTSDIVFKEANRLLFPNWNSEFSDSNSNSLLNNDIHCSLPNQLEGIFSEIPYGNFLFSAIQIQRNHSDYNAFLMLFKLIETQ
ncbi:transcriptional activator DEMETER [Spatholobus suberectus]|nr:transcriptional activator DEMETER [Spatholobus suberectus]